MSSFRQTAARLAYLIHKYQKYTRGMSRDWIASLYLKGEGIEIGALDRPLLLPRAAHARYVDRYPAQELAQHYPEIKPRRMVKPDVVDDGEKLSQFKDDSLDFVIANQFIEHCENPVGAIRNMLRVVKPQGIVFMAVPDKRKTFDQGRPLTSTEHLLQDDREGPNGSRRQHYEEYTREVFRPNDPVAFQAQVEHLIDSHYSIHFHVWDARSFNGWLSSMQGQAGFEFEVLLFVQGEKENFVILEKGLTINKGHLF